MTATLLAARDDIEVRHGYTPAEVERLTRTVTRSSVAQALDPGDAYEGAWGSIVERILAADTAPAPGQLVTRARFALRHQVATETRGHGNRARRDLTGDVPAGSDRNYRRFWDWHASTTPSPEPRIIDRAALAQIMPRLTGADREALTALAEHGNARDAAAALGLDYYTLMRRVSRARARFLRLWHEGEAPSRPWRPDVRGDAGSFARYSTATRSRSNPLPEYWRRRREAERAACVREDQAS